MIQKMHRSNWLPSETDNEDFSDCRISDVLPADLAKQIGLDPNTYLFDGSALSSGRRMTDPGLFAFQLIHHFPRRSNTVGATIVHCVAPSSLLCVPTPKILE
jgi:hypothetical protein